MQCRIIFLSSFNKFPKIHWNYRSERRSFWQHFRRIVSNKKCWPLVSKKKLTKSFYRVFVKSMERVIWNNKRVKLYRATVCCSNQRDLENKLIIQDIYVIIKDFQFASGAETGHNRKMLQTNVCQDRVRAPTFLSGDVQKLCCGTSWTLCKYS